MDATRRIFIRNAESRAEREKRGLLAVSNPLFCPCGIEEAENGFFFCFVTEEDLNSCCIFWLNYTRAVRQKYKCR